MSRPPSVEFNSSTICTSHCLAASSGYRLFCTLNCEHVWQRCERKSSLKQLQSKSCDAPHAPGPSRFCQLLLWKVGAGVGTSHHLSSTRPPDPVAFAPPSHLHSSLSQLSHLALSLKPCHQIFKWSFPSQISRTVLYPPCSFSLSTIFDS